MASRDRYGNYVNEKGVIIKINTDKKGGDHISFYGGQVDEPHESIHINLDWNNRSWDSLYHNADKSVKDPGSGNLR